MSITDCFELRKAVLSDEEKKALEVLRKAGWIVGCDCYLHDILLDGERRPTFKYEGRKPIVAMLTATEFTDRKVKAMRDAEAQNEEKPKKRGRPPKDSK